MAADIYWPLSGQTDVGDVWCRSLYDDHGTTTGIEVERSDPSVLISNELLRTWHEGDIQFASLRCTGEISRCPVGDVITIEGVNRRVIYVVAEPDSFGWAHIARWPD